MRKKGDLSALFDFERATVVGARRASKIISETAALLGFSCTRMGQKGKDWKVDVGAKMFC